MGKRYKQKKDRKLKSLAEFMASTLPVIDSVTEFTTERVVPFLDIGRAMDMPSRVVNPRPQEKAHYDTVTPGYEVLDALDLSQVKMPATFTVESKAVPQPHHIPSPKAHPEADIREWRNTAPYDPDKYKKPFTHYLYKKEQS